MNGLALCSGVGGLELGLRLAMPDYRVVCHVERETYSAAILATRMAEGYLDEAPIWDDLRTFDGKPWRGVVDIVSAGFPCQPVSCAGKQLAQADPRWLWPQVYRVVCEVAPRFVFLENVPGLLVHGFGDVLGDLAKGGFDVEWDVFSAAGSGAPHLRRRVFLLAYASRDARKLQSGQREGLRDESAINGTPEPLADASLGSRPGRGRESRGAGAGGEDVPDATLKRSSPTESQLQPESGPRITRNIREDADADGEPARRLAESWSQCGWWAVEPALGRVVDGCAHRVDQLRALGEGVVPAVACRAWRVLMARVAQPSFAGQMATAGKPSPPASGG